MKINKLTSLEEKIEENIKIELDNLDAIYSNYQIIENELCSFIKSKSNDLLSTLSKNDLNELLNKYELCISYIRLILSLIDILKRTLNISLDEYIKNSDKNYLASKLSIYNYMCDDLENSISKFENDFSDFNKIKSNIYATSIGKDNNLDINTNPLDNDTLLISEKKYAVILPYKHKDITNLLDTKKYSNEDEIIEKLYTIPLSEFKNSAISRFSEGYNLILKKEKGSFSEALDLGLELIFKSNLHPAIIRACKNLKELDFLLDCLDQNRLSDFSLFKIKFEMCPSII